MKMNDKERLIIGYEKDELDKKALRKLINLLLNPKQEELNKQLMKLLEENHACLDTSCDERKKMKGHPINCKNKDCTLRVA